MDHLYDSPMKKIFSFILILSFLLNLTSCSLAELGYRYGDWLIKRKILEVVKLYSPQQERLEKVLDDYMLWHKKTMLKRYQAEVDLVIKRVEEAFKDNSKNKEKGKVKAVNADDVEGFLLRTRKLYWESFLPLANDVAPILSELGEEQIDRSRTLINRKLDDVKDRAKAEKEDREAYVKEIGNTWKDNLEEWFGELSKEQIDLLNQALPGLLTSPKLRFARGVERMKAFLAIFEENPLPKKTENASRKALLEKRSKMLVAFFKSWSEESHYNKWRKNVSNFMASFFKTLSPEQKSKFQKKLSYWEKTLRELGED